MSIQTFSLFFINFPLEIVRLPINNIKGKKVTRFLRFFWKQHTEKKTFTIQSIYVIAKKATLQNYYLKI
jgi:hypothetical protein